MEFVSNLPALNGKKAVDGLKRKGVKNEHNGEQQIRERIKVLPQQD